MRKHALFLLMVFVTAMTGCTLCISVYAFTVHKRTMDAMLRSYVLDLTESYANASFHESIRHGRRVPGQRKMRLHIFSTMPMMQKEGSDGILILSEDGSILRSTGDVEKLLPLWHAEFSLDEVHEVSDARGHRYYLAGRRTAGENYVLAFVSRTDAWRPLAAIWTFWVLSATAMSFFVMVGMVSLWRYLVMPLYRIVNRIKDMKWGWELPAFSHGSPFFELRALSDVLEELAREAVDKEVLKARYVDDLVTAQEETRRQLSRELHDGPLQSVMAAIRRIQLVRASLNETSVCEGKAGDHLEVAEDVSLVAVKEIRDYCDELSPSWVKLGLQSAMNENLKRLSRSYERLHIVLDVDERLECFTEARILALIRITQEAVSNSVWHGKARNVRISLHKREGKTVFSVEDDGVGFSSGGADCERLRTSGHRGLANINERARLLGGTMEISRADGGGTILRIVF